MDRDLKFNFNSKEVEISFTPETFEQLKNLFLELYNEKSLKEINFKYIKEDKEILLDNENYQNFKNNEIVETIFVSNNLDNNFFNVNAESEYPTGDNRSYKLGETPNPEDLSIININYNPYQNYKTEEDKNKEEFERKVKEEVEKGIKEKQKIIEQLRNKILDLFKIKKEQNNLIKKYEEDLKINNDKYKKEIEELQKKIKEKENELNNLENTLSKEKEEAINKLKLKENEINGLKKDIDNLNTKLLNQNESNNNKLNEELEKSKENNKKLKEEIENLKSNFENKKMK